MTIALIAALVFVTVAHIVLLDRRDRRERAERADLLQRIQAPTAAVAEHHATVSNPLPEQDPLPMSDAAIADQQEREALVRWMERVENGDELVEDGVPS